MHKYDQTPSTHVLQYDEFLKVDIRVGTIIEVQDFPEARLPAFKLHIDFGPVIGKKWSSSRITDHYTKESLTGKQILAVVNFPPRQVGPMTSEVLTLGLEEETGTVVVVGPERQVPDGKRVY